jgi:hypothetical protein
MFCDEFQNQMADYLDGLLEQHDGARFGAHALQCRSCRSLLDDVRTKVREDAPEEIETIPGLNAVLETISSPDSTLECARFEETITEFLDGYVPARLYQKFAAHSSDCERCSYLLTDVVYAVAACHSVHTYEEVEVPPSVDRRLMMIARARGRRRARNRLFDQLAGFGKALLGRLLAAGSRFVPVYTLVHSRVVGGAALAISSGVFLLIGFSDEMSPAGVYRHAQVKAGEIYTQGLGVYSQKHELSAEVQRLGSNVTAMWATLDYNPKSEPADKARPGVGSDKAEKSERPATEKKDGTGAKDASEK